MNTRAITFAAWLGVFAFAPPVAAGLRNPQVPMNGSALQSYLNLADGNVDVAHDQVDVELLRGIVFGGVTFSLQIELFAKTQGVVFGLYDGHALVPTRIPAFPDSASAGWFALFTWRLNPTRLLVSLFDADGALITTTTYLGMDRDAIGFYVQSADRTYYSQDALNPGRRPQALFYRGTGPNSGWWWLCFEGESLETGSDRDFDDVVVFVGSDGLSSHTTSVQTTSWGRLKARFR